MIVKLSDCVTVRNIINSIMTIKMPLRGAYKINKIKQFCEEESQFFDSEFRKLIQEYAQRDENGEFVYLDDNRTSIKIENDKIDECNSKLLELNNVEVSLDSSICLYIEDLGGDDTQCTPEQISCLIPFIREHSLELVD